MGEMMALNWREELRWIAKRQREGPIAGEREAERRFNRPGREGADPRSGRKGALESSGRRGDVCTSVGGGGSALHVRYVLREPLRQPPPRPPALAAGSPACPPSRSPGSGGALGLGPGAKVVPKSGNLERSLSI